MKGIEYLKGLGAQRIHEDTRISKQNIEAIINKTYGDIHRVQFNGYVTLLEKEYGIDLTASREEFDAYCKEHNIKNSDLLFYSTHEGKNKRGWLIPLIVIIIVVIGYFVFNNIQNSESATVSETKENMTVESAIETIKSYKNEEVVVAEESVTDDNGTEEEVIVVEEVDEEEKPVAVDGKTADETVKQGSEKADETSVHNAEKTLQNVLITPKRKVWVGYINLDTREKYQKMTNSEISLSGKTNWLIVFGHGFITIQHGDTYYNMDSQDRVRFSYINGELKEITKEVFENMNEGKAW